MKIISGKFKGKLIIQEKKTRSDLRPTSSYSKSVLFNLLQHNVTVATSFEGKIICDAFCGIGSVGFEMLSRGADYVYFIDSNRESAAAIISTFKNLQIENGQFFLRELPKIPAFTSKIDILWLDAPYKNIEVALETLSNFIKQDALSEKALIIIEHNPKFYNNIELKAKNLGIKIILHSEFKQSTSFSFLKFE